MAEGGEHSSHQQFSPLEEQYIREAEEEGTGEDAQIQREKEMASQKLWCAFQDSATAVAHLFRDCQQQAGLAAWVPFQDSASAVTQLYKGSLEVCRQCVECGVRHGQRKRTREIVTWLKKKRRVIRRDELLAFLLDKPYTPQQDSPCYHFGAASEQSDVPHHPYSQHSHPAPSLPSSHITTRPFPVSSCIDGLNYSAPVPLVPLPIPMSTSDPCFSAPLPTPRGGRWALIGRDEQGIQSDAGDVYSVREGGRKRLNSSSTAANFEFVQESPPLAKRMKI